jgi:hypothetical protein
MGHDCGHRVVVMEYDYDHRVVGMEYDCDILDVPKKEIGGGEC